jgi:sRNA-binding carbon storage regulator CsrA
MGLTLNRRRGETVLVGDAAEARVDWLGHGAVPRVGLSVRVAGQVRYVTMRWREQVPVGPAVVTFCGIFNGGARLDFAADRSVKILRSELAATAAT